MRLLLDNVNLGSSSGPNSFGRAFTKELVRRDIAVDNLHECIAAGRRLVRPDAHVVFIESRVDLGDVPMFQRLDGIYYNSDVRYGVWQMQNASIRQTYDRAFGVIFQSTFSRRLVESFFFEHPNSTIIGNGVDLAEFTSVTPYDSPALSDAGDVWVAASNWRPHKRLAEDVRYFKEHAARHDVLVIAGETPHVERDDRIVYIGDVTRDVLLSLYARAKYFIHLAFHDNCPNVVVDARAAGCHIICAGASGSPSIAGPDATVIDEDEWQPAPIELYRPPALDFTRARRNGLESSIDIVDVVDAYVNFMRTTMEVSQ